MNAQTQTPDASYALRARPFSACDSRLFGGQEMAQSRPIRLGRRVLWSHRGDNAMPTTLEHATPTPSPITPDAPAFALAIGG